MISISFTVAVAEVAFRWWDLRGHHESRRSPGRLAAYVQDEEARIPGVDRQFRPYARFAHRYETNPRGYFDRDNRITYRLNRFGFRGPDYDLLKPPGTRRVVIVGDSFTFGAGVRFEHTFGYRLQKMLGRDSADPVEVLAFGVGGWSTADEISYLENEGMQFDPELAIVVFVLNDADPTGGFDLWENFRKKYEARRFKSSYLISYFTALLARRDLARRYVDGLVENSRENRQQWDASFSHLLRGKRIVESAGARYAVAIFPFMYALDESHPFSPLHEMISGFCRENRIQVLDLLGAFKGRSFSNLWVHPSDQHPNEKGHRIAAMALAEFIRERSLLAPSAVSGLPSAAGQ